MIHTNRIPSVDRLQEISCKIREREFTKPQILHEYKILNNKSQLTVKR